jgi:chemotaxis protein CheX
MSENEKGVDFGRNPFDFKPGEPYGMLKFFGDLDPDLAKEFEKRIRAALESFTGDLVVDFSECGVIHPLWTRPLMQIATDVKKHQKRLRAVSPDPAHKSFFMNQGIATSFPLVPDHATAERELTTKKTGKIDVAFINPFLEGTVEVLKKQAGTAAKAGTLGTRDPALPLDGDVSGVIGLDSESFTGSVIISFPEKTYLGILSRMLGETHAAITPENRDGASELMNIIFGFAKRVLSEQGHRIQMAIPTVVLGRSPPELPLSSGPRISIPFESDVGPFTVEIRVGTS